MNRLQLLNHHSDKADLRENGLMEVCLAPDSDSLVAKNIKSNLRSGEKLDEPFSFIDMSNGTHEIQRLEHHLTDVKDLTDRLDKAVKSLSMDVRSRWSSRHLPYTKVFALLIRWEQDDLGVEAESRALDDLLRRWFNYSTEEWCIPHVSRTDTYMALLNKVNDFLKEHDGPDNLLIIYYGGHARQDPRYTGPIWYP